MDSHTKVDPHFVNHVITTGNTTPILEWMSDPINQKWGFMYFFSEWRKEFIGDNPNCSTVLQKILQSGHIDMIKLYKLFNPELNGETREGIREAVNLIVEIDDKVKEAAGLSKRIDYLNDKNLQLEKDKIRLNCILKNQSLKLEDNCKQIQSLKQQVEFLQLKEKNYIQSNQDKLFKINELEKELSSSQSELIRLKKEVCKYHKILLKHKQKMSVI